MREILFRAKATNRDPNREYRTDYKNGDWVYGLISRVYDERFDFPAEMTNTSGISNIEVDPKTIGQYTGLTDKNGRKIFEGDILRFSAKNEWETKNFVGYEVFFHDNDCADRHIGWQMNRQHFYGVLCGGKYPYSFLPKWTSRMEVIGNIHDNPELVGGGADD